MLIRRALCAALGALALTPAAALAVDPGIVIGQRTSGVGVDEVAKTSEAGARWVRLFVDWSLIEPDAKGRYAPNHLDDFDRRVRSYRAKGVNVLMAVLGSPKWARTADDHVLMPPDNPADYGDFIRFLADRYKDQVAAYEVWNEPDGEEKTFWLTGPDPVGYTRLVQATWRALNGASPRPKLILAGSVGNNYRWYEQLYDAGIAGHFDAAGVHTDTACLVTKPEEYYREPDGRIGRFSFTGYREVRQVMVDRGDPKPIWMTELGWSTSPGKCHLPNRTRDDAGVSETTQADFLKQAYYCMQADDYLEVAFWFSLQDVNADLQYDHRLGLIRDDGGEKESYKAYKALFAAGDRNIPSNPSCGGRLDKSKPFVKMSQPTANQEYTNVLPVRATATDDGGVTRMELWADGKRVEGANQRGGSYSIDWNGSRELPLGNRTIEVRAFDEAGNYGSATVTVKHVTEATATRVGVPKITSSVKRSGRTVSIVARLGAPTPGGAKPRGRLRIFFEYKKGKTWKPFSRYTKGVAKTIRLKHRFKRAGTWRMYMRYAAQAPYKNYRTKPIVWKVK